MPVGGMYTADLPICAVISAPAGTAAVVDSDGDGIPDAQDPDPYTPDAPDDGTDDGDGSENRHRFTNEEQERTNTQTSGG
ncbi:hypothetical protein [Tropicibacter oceani]|uniref:Uncharacterized protein n=1 Tax=Tropicibacter oceani TaxID=3058420 RepID=A0ABY8QM22_9RHOB|nr:hypothetical protein [Tropicibacter oceani]WGW05046.1 hypothetical protein QF118_05715 [Tropicibacter oceani]